MIGNAFIGNNFPNTVENKMANKIMSAKLIIIRYLEMYGFEEDLRIKGLKYPYLNRASFRALCRDIRRNGLNNKILLSRSGKVVDGRARLAALLKECIWPTDDHFDTMEEDDDATVKLRFIQNNLNRQHLTKGQIAMAATNSQEQGVAIYNEDYKSLGTSAESVARAGRVLKSGNTAVIEAVRSGKMAVSRADKLVSGRVPISQRRARPAAIPATDTLTEDTQPRPRGRPSGDAKVNAFKVVIARLLGLEAHEQHILDLWCATEDELTRLGSVIALLQRLADHHSRALDQPLADAVRDSRLH